jgi:outer membrane receptor protein involved in Fe transport
MRTRLLASSMISGAALAAASVTGAQAQAVESTAAPAPATAVQELVVTGSRIPQKNLTSVSPITTVNNQSIKLQGTTNVEDLINNLPQAFADFGQFESNGSTGTATVDLRGLGSSRTLVLVDGKRVPPGDPGAPVADLNFIPPALIDRVEVLTGGASAVYGSDAVAGVVNFIMKHNYEGLQVDAEFSIGEHENNDQQVRRASAFGNESFGFPALNFPSGAAWAGARHTVSITGGANTPDDKGNVEFYMTYTSIDPVLESKYDWSTCGLATNNTNTKQQYCSGSTTDATGRLLAIGLNGGPSPNPGNWDILLPPVNGLMAPFSIGQAYNFAPLNYIQRPDIRWNAGEFSHYEIAPWLDLYSSFMFMDDHTVAQIAPSGSFFGSTYTIPCNDPLLSAAQANTICGEDAGAAGSSAEVSIGRRNIEGGPRISDIEHMDYRFIFGAKGDLGSGWSYDMSAQYGRTELTDVTSGYFLTSKIANALDVVPGPGGVPTCESVITGADKTCVPYNLWSVGGVTPAALNYLQSTAISKGEIDQQVVTGSIAGDLGQYGVKSPWSSDGVGISLGAEYHREYLATFFDEPILTGDLAGGGGPALPTAGSQADKDVFGEVRIPIVQNMPFFKDLTFEGGARYSDYTHGGGNWTYKAGGDWQVTSDIRLRASYERAVRAPNVSELFTPAVPGLVSGKDPCAGTTPTYTEAQCALTGVPASAYGTVESCISGQCGDFSGGNPNLTPEVGKTFSVGFVFTPTFFRGFSVSVDYFNITVDKVITTLPLGLVMNGCALDDIAALCADIHRDPGFNYWIGGSTNGFVNLAEINAASLNTKGIDVNADYRTTLSDWHLPDYGSLDFNLTGTWVKDLTTALPGQQPYDCAGLFGTTCGTPTPKWRHQFRISWTTPWNLTLSAAWRYLSPTNLDFNSSNPVLQNGYTDLTPTDAHIPAFSYFDMSFQYKFQNRYTVRGGVNNIFDRTPPLLDSNSFGISAPPFGNGNTYPQVFDPLGRVFFVGLTADF